MLISDNRKSLASGNIGSRSWRQKKDLLTHRKDLGLCLDSVFVQTLITCFLGNLCHSDSYIKPTTMEIEEAALLQQLTLTQVFYILSKTKMSVSGSQDQMAFLLVCRKTLPPDCCYEYMKHVLVHTKLATVLEKYLSAPFLRSIYPPVNSAARRTLGA